MTLTDVVAVFQLLAMLCVPVIGFLMRQFHKTNEERFSILEKRARKCEKQHFECQQALIKLTQERANA